MRKILTGLVIGIVASALGFGPADAQTQAAGDQKSRIEKLANRRLSGTLLQQFSGIDYATCETRCLNDPKCVALEFVHGGGRVFGRNAQCKLLSTAGEARDSQSADIGYKRIGAPKAAETPTYKKSAEQDKADRDRKQQASRPEPEIVPPASSPAPLPLPPPARAPSMSESAPPVASAPSAPSAPRTRSMQPGATPTQDWDLVPVFYGTDRNRRDLAKRIAYGSDRARRLELGQALVTVPKSHQVPVVERPWAIKIPYLDITLYQESEDPKRHFTIKELSALTKDAFLARASERLGGSKTYPDQALILIHGYNNGFDEALYRTAQIAYDLKFDGVPFLYSWPSGAGITSYPYDKDSASQAEQYLSQFLLMVLNETGSKSVNIIAHSMGNQPLLQVLRDLRRSNPNEVARINQIILAAPDVDRDAFEFLAGQIKGISRGITMYVSSNDVALGVSRRFAGGVPRAGDVPELLGPSIVPGIDTIDVSALSTEYLALNHSSYAEKSALIQDIELVLRTGERPPENRLPILERLKSDKGEYWRYPKSGR